MEYKPTFTKEEIEDIIHWFATHKLEQDIDLGNGVHIRELDTALKQLTHIAKTRHDNRVFSGQIYMLFKIKDELIKQGKVLGEK
ncbi:MAG: hypothetical protein IKD25_04940 [Bacteroidaceae bacterium]|nr:hypothetical protein [Bacteroidaceae bacterium]